MLSFPFPYSFRTRFVKGYECFPISKMGSKWEDMVHGGKIILPRSASQYLGFQSFPSPLLFKVTNNENNRSTHVGVCEFSAEEGACYIPDWIYRFLGFKVGDCLTVEQVALPVGTFVKFQPIGLEFLAIKNPGALLVIELHRYACLTQGDIIQACYNNHVYELRVVETKPAEAISLILDDLQMEFEAPQCHINPYKSQLSFFGDGLSLSGNDKKPQAQKVEPDSVSKATQPYGLSNFTYSMGEHNFSRSTTSIIDRVFPVTISQTNLTGKSIKIRNEEVD